MTGMQRGALGVSGKVAMAFHLRLYKVDFLASLHSADSNSNGRYSRRRPTLGSAKAATEDVTAKSDAVADQLALAASHTEKNPQRRGGAYASDGEDYPYGNLEMNLIRPESEPVHTQITAKYTTNLNAARPYESGSLEDAETAEEYVANAMKMQRYGTRLREPIRILSTESAVQAPPKISSQPSDESANERGSPASANIKYEYYNVAQQQLQQQQQQQHATQELEGNHKAILEAQLRAQFQAQIQQAQQPAESHQQFETQTDQGQASTAVHAHNGVPQQSAPTYSREPATRSYEVYDENVNSYEANNGGDTISGDGVDRHYRTKYIFQPAYQAGAQGVPQVDSEAEQLRVSASTEIPKAEIMKQIEKSVMKYMKELEAEGKIVTSPQEQKSYYKMVTVPGEEKHIGSTTVRPKYPGSTPPHNAVYVSGDGGNAAAAAAASHRAPSQANISGYGSSARHHTAKHQLKSTQRYQAEAETGYRAPAGAHQPHEIGEALAPNVEFVYKIKTRAPLQTATVKTISKPYTLPLKGSFEQFDHTAALKNIEDFDLSHVVTTQEPDERPSSLSASVTNKPNKLYFNSEIYHDINSLPYKPEKTRTLSAAAAAAAAAEYRKLKTSSELSGDYKGYTGYFAEPAAQPAESSDEKSTNPVASAQVSDDGYPIMNPYQYVLKKEPLSNKYEDSSASWGEAHAKPVYTALAASQKGLEYDSYSPKFNNNPEGYGYQHTYKAEREREREPQHGGHKYAVSRPNAAGSKRGKRGGGVPYPNVNKKSLRSASVKDIEANLALRPPPKN
ncbi:uncharacterized protein LOC128857707 [Anastrepha ludens]|uniref:uncharacterized protein LOC128857707 n=1 Tax=Anastrepha ludens TaxID=28586 RepID=UPI0023B1EE4B|nr:uncharacterized protein LOC128857707 [Anastrepha ludens]